MQNGSIGRGAAAAGPAAQRARTATGGATAAGTAGGVWLAALLVVPVAGAAYERVEYNGHSYACQHRCSITTFSDGAAHIRDAFGGWVARIEVDGGVIVDEQGKT